MLYISRQLYEAMVTQLQAAYPQEGCGLLAGQRNAVLALYPIENLQHSETAFYMNPAQQVEALYAMEATGNALIGIYHSHPFGPAYPSTTDIAQAHYPQVTQVIISLMDRQRPHVRAFTIHHHRVSEVKISQV